MIIEAHFETEYDVGLLYTVKADTKTELRSSEK